VRAREVALADCDDDAYCIAASEMRAALDACKDIVCE
jgi:hypothetical protein